MRTLVIDIETIGEKWNSLDETTKESLTRWVSRSSADEEAKNAAQRDIEEGLGFSPLTGSIVAIGLYDVEREKGIVYFDTNGMKKIADFEEENIKYRAATEKEMLLHFWEGAKEYDTFVTFNGRSFDIPFILIRGAVHSIRPSKDLMSNRYLGMQRGAAHVDLLDQLSFYGAVHRKGTLHLYCRAFGIESPKAEGVSGDDVAALFAAGKYETIARYNRRDIIATAKLYKRWNEILR
jgi:uncharacterized protein YprB with RNaseH-like and TPR domain